MPPRNPGALGLTVVTGTGCHRTPGPEFIRGTIVTSTPDPVVIGGEVIGTPDPVVIRGLVDTVEGTVTGLVLVV
ncbi:UNVERIFIED_CONTAM: hypothetical protein K2H54_049065 [Gekko kuhli]